MLNETFVRYRNWDRNTWNIKQEFLKNFNLAVNLPLAAGKYFIKIMFDIEIKIGIFEILNVSNFNKFWAFIILGLIWA